MNEIQSTGETTLRSVSTSVLKMQLDQAKVDGQAEKALIESAGDVMSKRTSAANPPGVGTKIDVQG